MGELVEPDAVVGPDQLGEGALAQRRRAVSEQNASGAVAGAVETLVAALAATGDPAGRTNRFVDQLTVVSQQLRRMTDPAPDA